MSDAASSENSPELSVESLRLLTVKEVIALTGLGKSTLYKAMADGRLEFLKIGGATRFRPRDVAAFIDGAGKKAA